MFVIELKGKPGWEFQERGKEGTPKRKEKMTSFLSSSFPSKQTQRALELNSVYYNGRLLTTAKEN
jgi:hypothetical protein